MQVVKYVPRSEAAQFLSSKTMKDFGFNESAARVCHFHEESVVDKGVLLCVCAPQVIKCVH